MKEGIKPKPVQQFLIFLLIHSNLTKLINKKLKLSHQQNHVDHISSTVINDLNEEMKQKFEW